MRRYVVILMSLCLVFSSIVSEAQTVLGYEELVNKYDEQSRTVEDTALEREIKEKEYEDILKSYDKLEESVEDALDRIDIYRKHVDQILKAADEADPYKYINLGFMRVKEKDYYLTYQLPTYMSFYSMSLGGYEQVVKMILPNYKSMEMLQHELEVMDQQEKVNNLLGRSEFLAKYYDYITSSSDLELYTFKKEVLLEEREKVMLDVEKGRSKAIEIQKLNNSLMENEMLLNTAKSSTNKYSEELKSILRLDGENIMLTGDYPEVKAWEPLNQETYLSVVSQENLNFQSLMAQQQVIEDSLFLVNEVYDDDELDGQMYKIKFDKDFLDLKKNMRSMATAIESSYFSYKTSYSTYINAQKRFQIAKDDWAVAQIKKDELSEIEYKKAKLTFLESENQFLKDQLTYMKSYNNYLIWLSGGTPQN